MKDIHCINMASKMLHDASVIASRSDVGADCKIFEGMTDREIEEMCDECHMEINGEHAPDGMGYFPDYAELMKYVSAKLQEIAENNRLDQK